MKPDFLLALAAALFAATAIAQPVQPQLTSGPGVALVTAKCVLCHDAGHITRSKLSRNEWVDNLANMITRGMPPLSESDARVIIDYLAIYYGSTQPPPAAPDTHAQAGPAGDPMQRLLDVHACSACHALDQRLVGPSFREIARRYAGDGMAASRLSEKIRAGGTGVWGNVPMPPNAGVQDADLASLVEWVLGRK